MKKLLDIF